MGVFIKTFVVLSVLAVLTVPNSAETQETPKIQEKFSVNAAQCQELVSKCNEECSRPCTGRICRVNLLCKLKCRRIYGRLPCAALDKEGIAATGPAGVEVDLKGINVRIPGKVGVSVNPEGIDVILPGRVGVRVGREGVKVNRPSPQPIE